MASYLAITGGVGGAKLGLGLASILDGTELVFVVNTGDDFEHLGWHISPDIDTLTYTLSGLANPVLGWGREDETWSFMETLEEFGGESWFRLGDRDLALHTLRTSLLRDGASLTQATSHITTALGIEHRIYPMSDQPVRTMVHTADGPLAFQHYFVRDRCRPSVTGFDFAGIADAQLNPKLDARLDTLDAIIICPSNPFVSVDPMLKIPGVRERLRSASSPVVAISPIVGGKAIKGPTEKMMRELNIPATAAEVANHYGDLLDGFILDEQDAALHNKLDVPTVVTQTVMVTLRDRIDLADQTLKFAQSLSRS
jgi:LPPG:FO 2-phospho-L-lactate transferase